MSLSIKNNIYHQNSKKYLLKIKLGKKTRYFMSLLRGDNELLISSVPKVLL